MLIMKKVGFDSSMRMAKEIIDIYPDKIKASPFEVIISGNITRYQWKLVSFEKLQDFNRIVGLEKIIKSCHFMIDNKLINYSNIDLGVIYFGNYSRNQLFLSNYLNYLLIDKNKIERIAINLFDLKHIKIKLGLVHVHYSHVLDICWAHFLCSRSIQSLQNKNNFFIIFKSKAKSFWTKLCLSRKFRSF